MSLQWIVETGGVITNAVSKQAWPGAAVVNVSIVNWVKEPPELPVSFVLDTREVAGITSSLRPTGVDVSRAARLKPNAGRSFQGPQPVGGGFVLDPEEAQEMLSRTDAAYSDVVRPYLIGQDIAQDPGQQPKRYVIDFGLRPLEDAMKYPAALEIVRERVKPFRDRNRRRVRREKWWLLGELVPAMREALATLPRYIAANRIGKRVLFSWQSRETCPSDLVIVVALDDDYSLGVLASAVHHEWARGQSSTLRTDIRYTPTSAFETFPWPLPTPEQREVIAAASRALIARRQEICAEREIGLTKLYNEVDDGAYQDLRKLHEELDEAVVAAYGWPKSAAHDHSESNRRLLELNEKIATGQVEYAPFGAE